MSRVLRELPDGRAKIDKLGTGRGRSAPPEEEPPPRGRIERRQQGRRGSTPREERK